MVPGLMLDFQFFINVLEGKGILEKANDQFNGQV